MSVNPTIGPDGVLLPGYVVQSFNSLFSLTMQIDGNVVLYNNDGSPRYATNTEGVVPKGLYMQEDGNLVLYDVFSIARFASNTSGNPGAFLKVQDDGNLVIYQFGAPSETAQYALWSSNTGNGTNDGQ